MTKRLGLYLGNQTSDRHQISKTNPSEGKDYITASISTFIKSGIWSLFANPVTYATLPSVCLVQQEAYIVAWNPGVHVHCRRMLESVGNHKIKLICYYGIVKLLLTSNRTVYNHDIHVFVTCSLVIQLCKLMHVSVPCRYQII